MTAGLDARIEHVRDQACRKASLLGRARGLTAVCVVWIVLGALDAFFRLADPGLRWMLSLAAWGALLTVCAWTYRWNLRANKLDAIYVARRIEQVFPQLRDRLASAYEFLRQPVTTAQWGSQELRRASIRETTTLADGLDLNRALDPRPMRPSLVALGTAGMVVLLLLLWVPQTFDLALRRLFMPWRDMPWPRANQLDWIAFPHRAAAGTEITLQIRDERGAPPDGVELWYRYDDEGPERVERVPMRRRDEQFVYRFEQLTRSIFVRAEGGDDTSMPWQRIEVDEPPRLESVDLRLIPPEYTGRQAERAGQPLRALAGTRVEIKGKATRTLASARIRGADGRDAAINLATVQADGVSFKFPTDPAAAWVLQQSGVFVLELTDRSGLRGEGQRFVVQVLPDDPPTLTWELPEPDSPMTARAVTPIVVLAKDDLAVRRVALRYRITTSDGPRKGSVGEGAQAYDEVSLYEGPQKLGPTSDMMGDTAGESRHVAHDWELSSIDALEAGSHLDLWIVAEDYKGQVVEAVPRRMQIISPAEYEERIGQREALLLHLLGEALRVERETHQQIMAVETLLREIGHLESKNLDQLQAAEMQQRQVGRLLGSGRDGARGMIDAMLNDVRRNNLMNAPLVTRLEGVATEVTELEREHLTMISPALIAVRKNAPLDEKTRPWPNAVELTAQIDQAARHADAVCQRLERLLGELSPWDELRRTMREFARLVRDEEEIQRQTATLLQDTEPDGTSDRATRRGAERSRLTDRQFELERRFAKLAARLEHLQADLTSVKPDDAQRTLATAVAAAKASTAGTRMREAGEQLSENRLGKALMLEGEVISELNRLVNLLSGRPAIQATPPSLPRIEQEIIRLLERQRQARERLDQLEEARKLAQGELGADEKSRLAELTRDERELAKTTGQLADDAQADAEAVALVLRGAAQQTERLAGQLAPDADWSLARTTLDAVIRRFELLRDSLRPDENGTDLDPQRKPPEQEPTETPSPQGAPRVRGLAELKLLQSLQKELQRRTAELETARRRRGQLTPELTREFQELASEQGRLAELVGKLLESSRDESNP